MTTSSFIAVKHGASLSPIHGQSFQSDCAIGRIGSN
jgi:hypothetical protein